MELETQAGFSDSDLSRRLARDAESRLGSFSFCPGSRQPSGQGCAHTDSQAKMVFLFLKDYKKQTMYNVACEAENTFWPFMKQYATPGFREFSPVRPQTSGEPRADSGSLARVPPPGSLQLPPQQLCYCVQFLPPHTLGFALGSQSTFTCPISFYP